ncbi:MAG: hypothetical protein U0625_13710 [Phycisphaerales bacterium]
MSGDGEIGFIDDEDDPSGAARPAKGREQAPAAGNAPDPGDSGDFGPAARRDSGVSQTGPWFVRFAGRRTGPHDVERLRTLARRGALTRMHQVSGDGVRWASALELRAVFNEDGSVAGGPAPAKELALEPTADLGESDAPADAVMPSAGARTSWLPTASVRPVVVAALVLATLALAAPTSRFDSLAWWWSEGALSFTLRGLGVLMLIAGWSTAFIAPEPTRAAAFAAVAAIIAAASALPVALWAPWAAAAALLVPIAAVMVALHAGSSRASVPMGAAVIGVASVAGLAEVALAVIWRSGWSIAGAVLGLAGAVALVIAGIDAARPPTGRDSRVFVGALVGATGSMACVFAAAFGALAGETPMHGAQAAVSACLVLAFSTLSWASVHEAIDTAHTPAAPEPAPDTLEPSQP